jgi:hypothetical protein
LLVPAYIAMAVGRNEQTQSHPAVFKQWRFQCTKGIEALSPFALFRHLVRLRGRNIANNCGWHCSASFARLSCAEVFGGGEIATIQEFLPQQKFSRIPGPVRPACCDATPEV